MTWTNAFDAGPCYVEVQSTYVGVLWSGSLAKGESSPDFDGYFSGTILRVEVDGNGVVSLMWVSGNSEEARDHFMRVVPNDASDPVAVRASDIVLVGAGFGNTGTDGPLANVGNDSIVLAAPVVGTAWTPNPATSTSPLDGYSTVEIYGGNGGS